MDVRQRFVVLYRGGEEKGAFTTTTRRHKELQGRVMILDREVLVVSSCRWVARILVGRLRGPGVRVKKSDAHRRPVARLTLPGLAPRLRLAHWTTKEKNHVLHV